MPDLFDITTPSNTLRLDERRQAEATYSVANLSGRLLTGRALIVPDKPEAAAWITIDGESERVFPIAGAQQYTIRLNVPKTAPPGSYTFRLDALDVSLPDETLVRGPSITFEVPQPEPEQRKFPVGILIIFLLVALLIIGGIIALAGRQPEPTPTPTATPSPTTADTPTPTATVTPTLTPTATPFGGAPGEISYMTFESGQPALFVMNSNGSGKQRITGLGTGVANFGSWLGHNAWSPTGDRIAFICNPSSVHLCILHLEDGLIDQITPFTGLIPRISWASGGNLIALDCQPPERSLPSICIVDVRDGSSRLLNLGEGEQSQPDWSPDGRRIAYINFSADGNTRQLFTSDANGNNRVQLTSGNSDQSDWSPSWSPDGSQIAFVSNRSGGWRIFTVTTDGGAMRSLIGDNSAALRNPSWSPDGRLLAYQSGCNAFGANCTIVVTSTDGSGLQTLVSAGGSGAWGPVWRHNARFRLRPDLLDRLGIQDNILVNPGIRRVPEIRFATTAP